MWSASAVTRPFHLLTLLAAAAAIIGLLGVGLTGCSNGEKENSESTITTKSAGKPTEHVLNVGESTEIDHVTMWATALYSTGSPLVPPFPMAGGRRPGAGGGRTFYQAVLRIENNGSGTVRVDPMDFMLVAGGAGYAVDPTRSGPSARSLLHGASLDFVVTFRAAEGLEPQVRYTPDWFNGTIVVQGELKPACVATGEGP